MGSVWGERLMSESQESHELLVEVGRYRKLSMARERGLVVAAREWAHSIDREEDEWVLRVESGVFLEAEKELAAFESEESGRPRVVEERAEAKVSLLSLCFGGVILGIFFGIQSVMGVEWRERGVAVSRAILDGAWWQTITGLTLHADGAHLLANLATGLLFGWFVLARLGSGVGWLAILLSGALGNGMNAWGYRGEDHGSIGASTACFGALGILIGVEVVRRWREPRLRTSWQLILPLGAGLGLLAFLGVGEKEGRVDYMAHCWGLGAGFLEGWVLEVVRVKEWARVGMERLAIGLTLGLLIGAWVLAYLH